MKKYTIPVQARVVDGLGLDRFDAACSRKAYFMDLTIKSPATDPARDRCITEWRWITEDVTSRLMRRVIEARLHTLGHTSIRRRKVAR